MTPKMYRRDGEGRTHTKKTSLLGCAWAEVRAALPWLALGFAIGAIVQAAGAMWRAL